MLELIAKIENITESSEARRQKVIEDSEEDL